MAVVGWWTGYKLGGVVLCRFSKILDLKIIGKFLFRCCVIACNIGLMFVKKHCKQIKQNRTDKMIQDKLGSSNILAKWCGTGTVVGPIISF